jgi:uncharacterized membrane protein
MQRMRHHLASPQKLFLRVALPVGLLLLFITPPFQVPDESVHFFRAYQLSEGEFIAEKRDELTGGTVPVSVITVPHTLSDDIPFNPESKQTVERVLGVLDVPLQPEQEQFIDFRVMALYTPVPHLPQALAIAVGRLFEGTPLILMILGRLAVLLATTALIFYAIQLTPIFKWFFFVFAFVPMATFTRSSLSADAVTNSLALLLVAVILRYALRDDRPLRARHLLSLAVLSAALALSKQSYLVLPLLYFLIPMRRVGTRVAYWGWFAVLISASLLPVLGWTVAMRSIYTPVVSWGPDPTAVFDPVAQVGVILTAPLDFLLAILRSFRVDGPEYARQFVGTLGWLDTPLPDPFRLLYWVVLLGAALFDGNRDTRLVFPKRLLIVAVGMGSVLLLVTIAYVMWNDVGSPLIYGLQGRYFIPIAPVLFLPLYNRRLRLPDRGKVTLVVFVVVSSLYTLYILLERYWIG